MKRQRKLVIVLVIFGLLAMSLAHKPRFPKGAGPFEVVEPSLSQAFYLYLEEGEEHVFVVPPLEKAEPIELLVLDNEDGRMLDFAMRWECDGEEKQLRTFDEPFHEPFSNMYHRYRVVDSVGPTETACIATIIERNDVAGPYTFAIGLEERWGMGDMGIFFSLGKQLERWEAGVEYP